MAVGPRTVEGIKAAVRRQQDLWVRHRDLARARASVSGFLTLLGLFLAVAFACFALISKHPWWIFGLLCALAVVGTWRAFVSAERHLASVPLTWHLREVPPYSEALTRRIFELPELPDTPHQVVNRTLQVFAQLAVSAHVTASVPARAALDDLLRTAEDAVTGMLDDSLHIEAVLRAARARPKDIEVQDAAKAARYRFQLPSDAIEAVAPRLLMAVSHGLRPEPEDVNRLLADLRAQLAARDPSLPPATGTAGSAEAGADPAARQAPTRPAVGVDAAKALAAALSGAVTSED